MRTVRELVAEFRGLSGTAKQKAVLGATGLARAAADRARQWHTTSTMARSPACSRR